MSRIPTRRLLLTAGAALCSTGLLLPFLFRRDLGRGAAVTLLALGLLACGLLAIGVYALGGLILRRLTPIEESYRLGYNAGWDDRDRRGNAPTPPSSRVVARLPQIPHRIDLTERSVR